MKKYSKIILLSLLIGYILSGCVASNKNTKILSTNIDLISQDYGKKSKQIDSLPNRVAIIPFKAKSKDVSKVVTRYFYNNFSSLNYKDIELGTIYRILDQNHIDLNNITSKDIKKLSKLLNVDGIVIGEVTDYDKLYAVMYSSVTVGAKIGFYNAKDGKKLWEFNEKAKKREGGISLDPIGIAMQLALAAYNLREVQLHRATEDLFRGIFKTIPQPTYAVEPQPAIIKFALTNLKSKKAFKTGDTLLFAIDSEPNLDLYVYIPGINNGIKATEIEDGHYELKYTIKNNHNANGIVEYKLTRKNGTSVIYADSSGKVIIDTTPPSIPTIKYTIENDIVKLYFINKKGDEVSKYIVDILKDGHYQLLMSSNKSVVNFPLAKDKEIFIKCYFEDDAGNRSRNVPVIRISNVQDKRIIDAKVLPTLLDNIVLNGKNVINSDTQITSEVYISKDAVLFIKNGVKLTFSEKGRIINYGELKFLGQKDSKINILSKSLKPILDLKGGITYIINTNIKTKQAIVVKSNAKIIMEDSSIKSLYKALSLEDSSYAEVKNSFFEAPKDMANIIIQNAAYGNFTHILFSKKSMFDISVNSTKKSTIKETQNIRVLGVIDVQ